MIRSLLKRYEIVLSSVLMVIFLFSSIILIHKYNETLKEFTPSQNSVYAQTQDVKGESEQIYSLNQQDTFKRNTNDASYQPTSTATPSIIKTITPTQSPSSTTSNEQPSSTTSQPPTSNENNENTKIQPNASSSTGAHKNSVLDALNAYRNSNGVGEVSIDQKLQDFAQKRADQFASEGKLDNHAGFQNMLNDNGFEKMGFDGLGENSSYGAWESGKYLIEEFYGKSAAHNESQLRGDWTHVGIGINGNATNIVFGGKKR